MEPDRRIRRIAIVGGGMAGWTAAAILGRKLGGQCSIHVIETPEPASAGQAEADTAAGPRAAAIPRRRPERLHRQDPVDLQPGHALPRLDAPRAILLASVRRVRRHDRAPAVLPLLAQGPARSASSRKIEYFSQEVAMASANRFIFPTNSLGRRAAPALRAARRRRRSRRGICASFAERAGTIRLERKVVSATRDEDGIIDELQFDDGGKLRADLFIDCSGARGQLIGEILGSAYDELAAVAALRPHGAPRRRGSRTRAPPYVRIAARAAGWQWRIPLQQNLSVGPGLLERTPGRRGRAARAARRHWQPISSPSRAAQQFAAGRRRKFWDKNVVAFGAAAGCLRAARGRRPASARPTHCSICSITFRTSSLTPPTLRATTPPSATSSSVSVTSPSCTTASPRRDDSPFWQECASLALPDSLAQRIDDVSRHRAHRPAAPGVVHRSRLVLDLRRHGMSCRATTIRSSTPSTSNRSNA